MNNVTQTFEQEVTLALNERLTGICGTSPLAPDDELGARLATVETLVPLAASLAAWAGARLTPRDLLRCATPNELAALLKQRRSPCDENAAAPVVAAPSQLAASGPVPASLQQEALWRLHSVEGSSAPYQLSLALRTTRPLPPALLRQACTMLVSRHAALRTTFRHDSVLLRQVVHDEPRFGWTEETLLADTAGASLAVRLAQPVHEPMDIEHGPLLRVAVYTLGAQAQILQFVVHHLVFDGHSRQVLLREFEAICAALDAGTVPSLGHAGAAPGEFALRQRSALDDARTAKLRRYWFDQLDGLPQTLDLPPDRERSAQRGAGGRTPTFQVPAVVAQRLTTLGAANGASLFMVLLAAWQVLLWRWSRQSRFNIGVPFSLRDDTEFEASIGYFVNTVVLAAEIDGAEPFAALLARVARTVLDAQDHKDLPFHQLVDLLKPERNAIHAPLFQATFEFHEEAASDSVGTRWRPFWHDTGVAKFDLALEIGRSEHGLSCDIEYACPPFTADSMNALGQQYAALLDAIASDPQSAVGHLPSLTAVPAAAGIPSVPSGMQRIHHLFERRARQSPDALAIQSNEQAISFAVLAARVDAYRTRLVRLGVRQGDCVAIMLERSVDLVAAVLAVLAADAAFLPIDPQLPGDRIEFMLDDSAAACLVTSRVLRSPVAARSTPTLYIDGEDSLPPVPATDRRPLLDAVAPAYVMYTSGTTGVPKGVVITHANVLAMLDAIHARYPLGPEDRWLFKTNQAFDPSVSEMFGWFRGEGSLVIAPPGAEGQPDILADLIERLGVTHMHFTPSMMRPFIDEVYTRPTFTKRSSLKFIGCGGEVLSTDLANEAAGLFAPATLDNCYGPTECTVYVSLHSCRPPEIRARLPIGSALGQVALYVLDDHMAPCATAVPGHLYVGGALVGHGYLNRPELTRERFIPNPFGAPGDRLYRTGDLARWLPDGELEFLGRKDTQVKIRGYRIELGEIEAMLLREPAVAQAAVLVEERGGAPARMIGCIVPSADASAALLQQDDVTARDAAMLDFTTMLGTKLAGALPEYMVPSAWALFTRMPLGITGKIDRRALLEEALRSIAAQARSAPAAQVLTPREAVLRDAWMEVLRLPHVGLDDNFFALGGDSILAIQVASRARLAGVQVAARDVFRFQTVRLLAQAATASAPAAVRAASSGVFPLLPIHRYFFEHDAEAVDHYQQSLLLAVPKSVDPAFLTAWIKAMQIRHDALQLRFRRDCDQWQAHYGAALPAATAVMTFDAAGMDGAAATAAAQKQADALRADVRLDGGLLLRALLLQNVAGEPDRVLLVCHHVVVDGISWRILLDDLRLAHEQWQAARVIDLPPGTDSYQAWGQMLTRLVSGAGLDAERALWRQIAAAPVERLLPDVTGNADPSRRTRACMDFTLTAEATAVLLTNAQLSYDARIQELLLAALLQALHDTAGLRSLRLWLEGHGRETEVAGHLLGSAELDLTQTMGWFTTIYPLILALPPEATSMADVVRAVRASCRSLPGQGLGYGVLRRFVRDPELIAAEASQAPTLLFNYLGNFDSHDDELGDILPLPGTLGDDVTPARRRDADLSVECAVRAGQLQIELAWATNRHSRARIERLGIAFVANLQALAQGASGVRGPRVVGNVTVLPAELADWTARHGEIAALWPASGLQRGLIFHSLRTGEASAYTNQGWMTLAADLDRASFMQAWRLVIQRHACLRSAFVGFDREQPLQAVLAKVPEVWRILSLPAHIDGDDAAFAAVVAADKLTPFDFTHAPLLRLALAEGSDGRPRFLISFHHAILDGWSVSLLWQEVFAFYTALRQGQAAPHLPAARPEAWIEGFERHARYAGASTRAYWRGMLAGRNERTVLRFDLQGRGTPGKQVEIQYVLDEALGKRLVAAARACQVTPAILFQATWALVLSSYAASNDVLFGVTVSGRALDIPGADQVVGLLINSVPARFDLGQNHLLRDWLSQLQQDHAVREEHSWLDLVSIQRECGWRSSEPLFDTLLVFENYPRGEQRREDVLGATDNGFSSQTHYPLSVIVTGGTNFTIDFGFDPTRFHLEDIQTMADTFKTILGTIPDKLDQPTSSLLNRAAPKTPDGRPADSRVCRQNTLRLGRLLVPQLFEKHAQDTPERTAIVCNGSVWTYAELDRAANRLAQRLLTAFPDIGADTVIGLRVGRSERLAIAILAIWKAGAAFIPLDPVLPARRVREMLQPAEARLLITEAAHAAGDRDLAESVWVLEEALADMSVPDDNPEILVSGNDLAYVLFTSGSTGTPKGAMVEHIGMWNNMANKAIDLDLTQDCRVAQSASMSFDVFVWQMFIALTQGGATHIYDEKVVSDVAELISRLARERITILEVVPTYLLVLVEFMEANPGLADSLALTHLLSTGEAIDAQLIRRFFALCPRTRVVNAYGPTEASDDITHHVMCAGDTIENPVPVGRALANFDIYVVDEALQCVPVGTKGDIVVTGVGVGRGYIGMAGATAKAFVESPFPDRYKGRLYKTGDVGYMREDGLLVYSGRKDKQVKIRGMRIELEEIELKLCELPQVRKAAVIEKRSEGGPSMLCAFVVPATGHGEDEIVAALREVLPPFMVPSVFRFEEDLPELASGKIDRQSLAARPIALPSRAAAAAPSNEIEARLVAIWREVFAQDDINAGDDFFEAGGDSFKAIRIAAKYGAPLEVGHLYDYPTIAALAAYLATLDATERRLVVPLSTNLAQAEAVVLCFANSAGGPVSFHEMARALAAVNPALALCAVQLPRNNVTDAAAMAIEVNRLAAEICDTLAGLTSAPLLTFAQCNGSALAIAVARELHRRHSNLRAFCVGGALMRNTFSRLDQRTDDDIFAFLGSMGAPLPTQPEERAFFLHDFRYDCRMADAYYDRLLNEAGDRLDTSIGAPAWCLVGTVDPLVEGYAERHRDWLRIATDVHLVEIPGHGHYLLRDCPDAVARAVDAAWQATKAPGAVQ